MKSFERRIYIYSLVIIFSFIPTILLSIYSLHKLVSEQKQLISVKSAQLLSVEKLKSHHATQAALMPIYILTGDQKHLDSFDDSHQEFNKVAKNLARSETKNSKASVLLKQIQISSRELKGMAQDGISLRQSGSSIEEVNDYFAANSRKAAIEMRQLLRKLETNESQDLEKAKTELSKSVDWIVASMIVLLAAGILLIFYMSRLLIRAMREKRARDEMRETLLQARKEAVEVVAHDLKNPLSTIKMSVQLALEEIPANMETGHLKQGLEIAQRSANSMERLIRDILDHAKIEAGHLILERQDYNLASLIGELSQRFEPLAENKSITLLTEITNTGLFLNCDIGRVEQVISNLIGNAIKFTPALGQVLIKAESVEQNIVISVRDTGAGLREDQIEHIFDRFWQVKETAKNGSGLGLAISKAIVDAHGGNIWVESSRGKGSTFFVSLPGFPAAISAEHVDWDHEVEQENFKSQSVQSLPNYDLSEYKSQN